MMRFQGSRRTLCVSVERWPLKEPFRITNYTFTGFDVITVSLQTDGVEGRGEATGVYYRNETPDSMAAQIETVRDAVESGADRQELLRLLPAGGARNALDCALWDLEAKHSSRHVWKLAGLDPPHSLLTVFTLGADHPGHMAEGARRFAAARALKLKLTGEDLDAERVRVVRAARPDVVLAVDANQGFSRESFQRLLPALVEARVALVEQPFPVGREADLDELRSPIRIAADESVQDHGDIERLVGRVDIINIKLDKCGGLTEALHMAEQARRLGFDLMVGNMSGTSLAMAPAFLLGQLCQVVDLDGPFLLKSDRSPGIVYEDGFVWSPDAVWGAPLGI